MMNLYIISFLEVLGEKNIALFSGLNFVKSAVFFSDVNELSHRLKSATDFYFSFLQQIEFLPLGSFKMEHLGHYDFTDLNSCYPTVNRVLYELHQQELNYHELLPVYVRYTDGDSMHLVIGIAFLENKRNGFLHIVDICLPKVLIKSVPSSVTFVRDVLDSYDPDHKLSLRELVKSKGYNYNQFQKDCKVYFGDTFYSFFLKLKMIEASGDIIFTGLSLKEIAFKNKFLDYANMYKTFVRYGLNLTQIPRLALL